uniref:GDSL esterase/lipase n=1 Tax=Lotus japonicus TaxID=34305 RepID=I3SN20_LOTJA|nr:unknown [Lotus japonicus]
MRPLEQLVSLILLSLFLSMQAEELKSSQTKPCDFSAIFNFGDSNSDTGCTSAAFYPATLMVRLSSMKLLADILMAVSSLISLPSTLVSHT